MGLAWLLQATTCGALRALAVSAPACPSSCPRLHHRRYDLPLRQHTWARRFFWRSVFDMGARTAPPARPPAAARLPASWQPGGCKRRRSGRQWRPGRGPGCPTKQASI